MAAALALAIVLGAQTGPPFGAYQADLSRVKSPEGKSVMPAYFNQGSLVLNPNGTFVMAGLNQEGYWRTEEQKHILVFDGFFRAQSRKPEAELRKVWPKNHLEGLILEPGPTGTLILSEWGRGWGPVIFRPKPKQTMTELLVASNTDDLTPAAEEAMALFWPRLQDEWPEVIRFINDAGRTWEQRSWAAILLINLKNPKGLGEAARLIFDLKPTNVKGRDGTIRRGLARAVARTPSDATGDLLIDAVKEGLLQASDVAPALGRLKRKKDVPLLIEWLDSKREYDRIHSLEALTQIAVEEALPSARRLTADPQESVQLAAHGLLARVSKDPAEKKSSIIALGKWIKSKEFLLPFAAIDALCESKAPEALPHLAAILVSDMPALYRRNTATALGDLGDLRAVPALIEAVGRESGIDDWVAESEVARAAAEALVKLGKVKRGEKG